MGDPLSNLIAHNSGCWHGWFMRLNEAGSEQERFPTQLEVQAKGAAFEACLTYLNSGQQRRMQFSTLPSTMQVNSMGCWSLGPLSITPWNWVGELCVVVGQQRRRIIVRHSTSGIQEVVYVREAQDKSLAIAASQPLQCSIQSAGPYGLWTPEPGVDLLIDSRQRQMGDATCCGLRWAHPNGETSTIVRRYGADGMLQPIDDAWP